MLGASDCWWTVGGGLGVRAHCQRHAFGGIPRVPQSREDSGRPVAQEDHVVGQTG